MKSIYFVVPESEIMARIRKAKSQMAKQNIQALLLTHKPDIFYFSGTAQDCYLLIDCEKEPMLFVKRYLPRAKKESFLKTILPIASIRDIPERIKDFHHHWPKNLGLAFDVVPVKDYLFFQRLLDGCGLTDGTAVIDFCRKIKSDWELQQIKQAAAISKQTFEFAQTHLECGMTEMEFCGIIEAFARKQGHSGKAQSRHYRAQIYPFHLVSGKNGGMPGALDSPFSGTGVSTIFPFGPGPKKIKKNEPVLFDFSAIHNGYHMDETRMLVMGKMDDKQMDVCKKTMEILFALVPEMKPGVTMESIYERSLDHAKKLGIGEGFLGLPEIKSRFIGHGIGIELVESPYLAKGHSSPLEAGMVFAVEPKFIQKEEFGVGIESVVMVTPQGGEFISTTEHKVFVCK